MEHRSNRSARCSHGLQECWDGDDKPLTFRQWYILLLSVGTFYYVSYKLTWWYYAWQAAHTK